MEQHEATLEELLEDPIIRKVMVSDGVDADDIRQLMHDARIRTLKSMFRNPGASAAAHRHLQA